MTKPLIHTRSPIIYLVFNIILLALVQVDLDDFRTIQLDSHTFANNLSREAQVLQDTVVNWSQSTAEIVWKNNNKPLDNEK